MPRPRPPRTVRVVWVVPVAAGCAELADLWNFPQGDNSHPPEPLIGSTLRRGTSCLPPPPPGLSVQHCPPVSRPRCGSGVLVERGLEVLSLAYDRRCAELAAASPLKQTLVAHLESPLARGNFCVLNPLHLACLSIFDR